MIPVFSICMNLKRFTDLGLRILIYLANEPDQNKTHSLAELSEHLSWNPNLVIKVANTMVKAGWLVAVRGRNGGLKLACDPQKIRIGDVVRTLEGHTQLVDCATPPCPFMQKCVLVNILNNAEIAFYAELDKYTVEDLRFMHKQKPINFTFS